MIKAAAYLRVSTSEQSTDNQLPAIEQYCQDRGYDLVEVYREDATSWKAGHQAELARLLNDINRGRRKYDRLVIWSLDRLTRAGIGQVFGLIHTFRQYGCQVVSCNEPWLESAGPAGELLLAVTAWIAEFESKRRSDRTLAGLERARANGKTLGRPKGSKDKEKRRKKRPVALRYGGTRVNEQTE